MCQFWELEIVGSSPTIFLFWLFNLKKQIDDSIHFFNLGFY